MGNLLPAGVTLGFSSASQVWIKITVEVLPQLSGEGCTVFVFVNLICLLPVVAVSVIALNVN